MCPHKLKLAQELKISSPRHCDGQSSSLMSNLGIIVDARTSCWDIAVSFAMSSNYRCADDVNRPMGQENTNMNGQVRVSK